MAIEIKAAYRVGELATMMGVDRFTVLRLLRKSGIDCVRAGRMILVPLESFRAAFPSLWASILLRDSVRDE